MHTVARTSTRKIAAITATIVSVRVYDQQTGNMQSATLDAAMGDLYRYDFSKLVDNGNGTYNVNVHSNLWYVLYTQKAADVQADLAAKRDAYHVGRAAQAPAAPVVGMLTPDFVAAKGPQSKYSRYLAPLYMRREGSTRVYRVLGTELGGVWLVHQFAGSEPIIRYGRELVENGWIAVDGTGEPQSVAARTTVAEVSTRALLSEDPADVADLEAAVKHVHEVVTAPVQHYVVPTTGPRLTDRHDVLGPYNMASLAKRMRDAYRAEGIECDTLASATRPTYTGSDTAPQELVWCETHNPAGSKLSTAARHTVTPECKHPHNAGY